MRDLKKYGYVIIHFLKITSLLFLQKSTQDKQDELNSDFAEVNKTILDVKARIQELSEEITSRADLSETSKGKRDPPTGSSPANEKLAEMKTELTKLEMEKQQILDRMTEA